MMNELIGKTLYMKQCGFRKHDYNRIASHFSHFSENSKVSNFLLCAGLLKFPLLAFCRVVALFAFAFRPELSCVKAGVVFRPKSVLRPSVSGFYFESR